MASKRRVRHKACEGKVRHETAAEAWGAAGKTRGNVRSYKCRFCSGWHCGLPPGKLKRKRPIK